MDCSYLDKDNEKYAIHQLNSLNLIGKKSVCYEKATGYDSGKNSLSDDRP